MTNNKEIIIEFPKLDDLINKRFVQLWNNKDRYLILYGSRASSKSDFVACLIVYRMLNDEYFKGIAIKKTYRSIAESTFATILKVIDRFKLNSFFKVTTTPYKITCLNGNTLLFTGLDDPNKVKSTSDPNFAWYEEDAPETEEDWITISTTLRSPKAKYIQEIFTINPVIEDYESNWFYKMFFKDEPELNFRKKFEIETEEGTLYTQWATIHHSTFRDNKWLDENALAKIELLSKGDAYLYQVYNLGIWANKTIEGRFFRGFDITKNISENKYNPDKPLHISFDFNVRPYSAATLYQIDGKTIYQIDEICVLNKQITTSPIKQTCLKIKEKYSNHSAGMYIYGDPSGRQEDTRGERGHNDFTIIQDELKAYRPELRVATSAPSVKTSRDFINEIFTNNVEDMVLKIGSNCKETLKDLQYLKVDREGGKLIEKYKDEDGAQVEKYGHTSDTLRYFITSCFSDIYSKYKNPIVYTPPTISKQRASKHRW